MSGRRVFRDVLEVVAARAETERHSSKPPLFSVWKDADTPPACRCTMARHGGASCCDYDHEPVAPEGRDWTLWFLFVTAVAPWAFLWVTLILALLFGHVG